MAALLPPEEIVRAYEAHAGRAFADGAMFLGTVPLRTGRFVFGEAFDLELEDLDGGGRLSCSYRVDVEVSG
jgi:hypothetical protein